VDRLTEGDDERRRADRDRDGGGDPDAGESLEQADLEDGTRCAEDEEGADRQAAVAVADAKGPGDRKQAGGPERGADQPDDRRVNGGDPAGQPPGHADGSPKGSGEADEAEPKNRDDSAPEAKSSDHRPSPPILPDRGD
jgi:hypothetical protein